MAKGYSHQEDIDYTKTYAHMTRLEAIRIFLSFVAHSNMKLYQMDVKSTFLNGLIQEEVYDEQLPGLESNTHPNHVFKLNKALCGLKQAPQAWYKNKVLSFCKMTLKEKKWTQLCSVRTTTHSLY